MNILIRKKYDTDKQTVYESIRAGLESDLSKRPDYRIAETGFWKAKLHCLLHNYETASEVG